MTPQQLKEIASEIVEILLRGSKAKIEIEDMEPEDAADFLSDLSDEVRALA